MKKLAFLIILSVVIYAVCTQITIFVIQPIGAIPEGKTLIIHRLNKTNFIDSADAICERLNGGVNLICRMGILSAVGEKSDIILRLPYSSTLYEISTGGKTYKK